MVFGCSVWVIVVRTLFFLSWCVMQLAVVRSLAMVFVKCYELLVVCSWVRCESEWTCDRLSGCASWRNDFFDEMFVKFGC